MVTGHAPLREGGAARRETVLGLRLRSEWSGRREEYCGWPSMPASTWSIRKGLTRLLPVWSCTCRDGTPQYSPRRGPCCLSFSKHGHPIHGRATPLSEGGECLRTRHSPNTALQSCPHRPRSLNSPKNRESPRARIPLPGMRHPVLPHPFPSTSIRHAALFSCPAAPSGASSLQTAARAGGGKNNLNLTGTTQPKQIISTL